MKRSTAMIITVVTALACGLPSLLLLCVGILALVGAQMPEVMANTPGTKPGDAVLGSWIFICVGAGLLLVPITAGIFSFRMSEGESDSETIEPLS